MAQPKITEKTKRPVRYGIYAIELYGIDEDGYEILDHLGTKKIFKIKGSQFHRNKLEIVRKVDLQGVVDDIYANINGELKPLGHLG